MNKKFNGTTVETNGVRTIEGGGTGATTAAAALTALGAATAAQGAKADSALQPGAAISAITGLQTALSEKASTSHKSTHASGGSDVLSPADIGAFGLKTYYSVAMSAGESSKTLTLPANETNIEVSAQAFAVPSGTITINLPAPAPIGSLVTIYTNGWSGWNTLVVQEVGVATIVNETYSNPQGSFNKIWYIQKRATGWTNVTSDIVPKSNWNASPGAKDEILNKPPIPTTAAQVGAEPAFTTLPVNKGGTGATTAAQALTALGAATAAQGAKADLAVQKNTADTTPVNAIRAVTQQEYSALAGNRDPNTIYFIKQ